MRTALLLFGLCCALFAAVPQSFRSLGEALEQERQQLRALQGLAAFDGKEIDRYAASIDAAFETGRRLDAAEGSERVALRETYLAALRVLQRQSSVWGQRYARALDAAVTSRDRKTFEQLVSHPLSALERPSFRQKALAYYETFRDGHPIAAMEALREAAQLEEERAAFLATERAAFEKHREVLSRTSARQSRLSVLVSTRREGNRFYFDARNRNPYPVTLTLELPSMNNFLPSHPVPRVVELSPRSEAELLRLDVADRNRRAAFSARYSWVMGLLSARHSDPLYRLPFAAGKRVTVTQGFDGGVTHTGLKRYAVDFRCPVGTRIYAARGGRVVAAESRHRQGGFAKRFASDANYVVIEHDDHTLGKYYHLRQHGVTVRVGAQVAAGQPIGYSGNTGYSTGPHLHFSVSTVDPVSKRLPVTLPMRFKTGKGIVTAPKTNDVYTAVDLRP